MRMDVAIVGGGLSGLALLDRLLGAGVDAHLFEARWRFGGRVLTEEVGGARLDLGPSWFWPGQPRIAALIDRLGLEVFAQHATGDLVYEEAHGIRRIPDVATMAGALRVRCGMGAIVDALVSRLPHDRLHADAPVVTLHADGRIMFREGGSARAERIVLALPPRIAATLAFEPQLDTGLVRAMEAVPTWMAGHAKFAAIYETPFWRADGLNGGALCRVGPLAEVHDASPADSTHGALFGFVGIDAAARMGQGAEIANDAVMQLARLFGELAATPVATRLVDWSDVPETATPADRSPPSGHPAYRPLPSPGGSWRGRLTFAGTEQALDNGGLLEGALEAAEQVIAALANGDIRSTAKPE